MSEFDELCAMATRRERMSSRRLARRLGLPEAEALRATLEMAAAGAGLADVAQLGHCRSAQRAADAAKLASRREKKAGERRVRLEKLAPPAGSWLGWFDGSTLPYPGRSSIGAILQGPGGQRLQTVQEVDPASGSNDAEYLACIALLELALEARPPLLLVHGDSQVVIGDLTAPEAAASALLRPHRLRAQCLVAQLAEVRFLWIPRRKNAQADALSRSPRAATVFI